MLERATERGAPPSPVSGHTLAHTCMVYTHTLSHRHAPKSAFSTHREAGMS